MVDRFATWPICYAIDSSTLYFASRTDELPESTRGGISSQSLFSYLFSHVIPGAQTIFNGVERLLPGEVVEWHDGSLSHSRHWKPVFVERRSHPDGVAASRRVFLDLVEQSVARDAEGYGDEVGAFLSGGTDSSTVSGMLCKVTGKPANTYSMGFDASGYDEMEYARLAARHFGTNHHEYYVTADDLEVGIRRMAVHYDQPFGNSSAVPALICAERAKQDGIGVLLAGDGGDELFGGNTRYAKQRVFGWYQGIPAPLRHAVMEPLLGLRGTSRVPLVKKAVSYVEQACIPMPDRMQSYNMLSRLGLDTVFTSDFLSAISSEGPLVGQRKTWDAIGAKALINQMLAFDWKYTLTDSDLPKVIGATQVAGLDVAFPLLSDELVDFSLQLPPEWKLNGLQLRWFFKSALKDFLPQEIIKKKKHGFGLPFGLWVQGHAGLTKLVKDALGSFSERGVVRPDFLAKLINEHLPSHPGYYGELVWILMMLELWLREHSPAWRSGDR